ncbi:hypothetical protein QLQ12_20765 [Actinoplanes sp. NEAU-A12]|uniref:AAA+ ATPase domain-containing protein n=1 Tax=Actinoplanes sandaracinus TaxID=3045177 RepID=A0ABT6WMW9_9ACTN|nr:AAA family ATPase [Actinoplanes sandaracinus]MDI6101050.1 hypothetical protein [Actinoplanes sandaracinus]
MPKTLSYTQAVRILGRGPGAEWMRRLNDLTGGVLLGATTTLPAVLSWFDAHAVFAKLSQQLAGTVGQRLTGAHRLDRTERVAAAHTVIVIAAWFDALGEAGLPFDTTTAEFTSGEQFRLAGSMSIGSAAVRGRELAGTALRASIDLPEPHGLQSEHRTRLRATYRQLSTSARAFLRGLALWDALGPGEESRVDQVLTDLPEIALERYERMLMDLRLECPEVDLWARGWSDTAFEESVRDLHESVRDMRDLMRRVAGSAAGDGVPLALSQAYAGMLDRPIVGSTERPTHLDMPTLRAAYLPSLFRIAEAVPGEASGEEQFWTGMPVRGDLHAFLTGYLTSPRAQGAPLVVLGHPGAGKSVLTKVLAAELTEGGFIPVRVSLRDVDSSLGVQRQIEQAIQDATGESVTWPRLAEAAVGRLPVVMLDGFDELLQATATSQSDYLHRVAEFQQRERDLGRAVAVVVTTRTSVAGRAVPPPDTLLLRLEPFDTDRVAAWLTVWHATNEHRLAGRGLRALPASVALRFPDLAGQPLLLLLLALYDADANDLQNTVELSSSELYERLLAGFARREVRKAAPHLSASQCEAEVEVELRRLSIVAFAMLNRSAQWVTERDLERDLTAVFGPMPGAAVGGIGAAGLLLGRFFFVHRAQAVRGTEILATYEFLHATFGEYLVARFTWQLLGEAVVHRSITASPAGKPDGGLLAGLLSFVTLAVRSPILRFLGEFAAALPDGQRVEWAAAIVDMYRRSEFLDWGSTAGDYRPVLVRMPARYAAHTANLVLLAALLTENLLFSEMVGRARDAGRRHWHDQALLWHSQLRVDGWNLLTDVLAADQCWNESGDKDVRLRVAVDGSAVSETDHRWLFSPSGQESGEPFTFGYAPTAYCRPVRLHACDVDGVLLSTLEPVLESPLAPALQMFAGHLSETCPSALQALFRVWLIPVLSLDAEAARAAYLDCASFRPEEFPTWDRRSYTAYLTQLLAAFRSDLRVPGAVVLEVMDMLFAKSLVEEPMVEAIASTAASVLHRGVPETRTAARLRHIARLAERIDADGKAVFPLEDE